jgi:hypothetical protein
MKSEELKAWSQEIVQLGKAYKRDEIDMEVMIRQARELGRELYRKTDRLRTEEYIGIMVEVARTIEARFSFITFEEELLEAFAISRTMLAATEEAGEWLYASAARPLLFALKNVGLYYAESVGTREELSEIEHTTLSNLRKIGRGTEDTDLLRWCERYVDSSLDAD